MGRRAALFAEVIGCADESGPEVPVPDPVRHDAGGERMIRMSEPLRKLDTTTLFGRNGKSLFDEVIGERGISPRDGVALRGVGITAGVNGEIEPGLAVLHREGEGEFGTTLVEGGERFFEGLDGRLFLRIEERAGLGYGRLTEGGAPLLLDRTERPLHEDKSIEDGKGLMTINLEPQKERPFFQVAERDGTPAEMLGRFSVGGLAEDAGGRRFIVELQFNRSRHRGCVANEESVVAGFGNGEAVAHPLVEPTTRSDRLAHAEGDGLEVLVPVEVLRLKSEHGT